MNYQQALDYIYSFINYERSGMPAISPTAYNLGRIERLLEIMGKPQQHYPSIIIAGTKGKGSTAALCAAAFQAAGYRVGLYTQPHLHTYRERIVVNGQMISREALVELVQRTIPAVDKVLEEAETLGTITTYEVGTALALQYFAEQQIQVAVLEIGLGGRLDAVNVVSPLVSVISSISYDHTHVLGNTLTKIAGEKAGIIKPGGIVVSAAQRSEAEKVIAQVSREKGAKLYRVGQDFLFERVGQVKPRSMPTNRAPANQRVRLSAPDFATAIALDLPLMGKHQQANAALALGTLLVQAQLPDGLAITSENIRQGFEQVRWPVRLEVLQNEVGQPLILADGAHNADSAARLRDALARDFYYKNLIFVVGSSNDKDIEGIFARLKRAPAPAGFVLTRSIHPRATNPEVLRERGFGGEKSANIRLTQSIEAALAEARQMAGAQDLICFTGSLFVAAEARELFGLATESDGRPD